MSDLPQSHIAEGTSALVRGGKRGFDDEGLPVYVSDPGLDHGEGCGQAAAERPAGAIDLIPEPGSGQEGSS